MLDDGRLTDNKGRVVNFANTMLVLTSNVGSRKILSMARDAANDAEAEPGASYQRMRGAVKAELGSAFRPEFLNRLDEVIVFESLSAPDVSSVATLMLAELIERCAENGIQLSVTDSLTQAVAADGFSSTYGARPLRRAVQRMCEDGVAEAILEQFVQSGETLMLDAGTGADAGSVVLRNAHGQTRVHQPSSAAGIEDDAGVFGAPSGDSADGLAGVTVRTRPQL